MTTTRLVQLQRGAGSFRPNAQALERCSGPPSAALPASFPWTSEPELHLLLGLLCLTVIGIPLGLASMKMAKLALTPLGRRVVPVAAAGAGAEFAVPNR